jgi:RHS repeat-associated protein
MLFAPPGYPSLTPDAVDRKFTGKERDAETGLDFFGARYFSSAQGRFTSPDPAMSSAKLGDPQTWNRYAYVTNNPLRYVDSDGRDRLEAAQDAAARDYLAGRISRQQLADRTIHTGPAGLGVAGAGAMVAASAVALAGPEALGAAALGLYNLATRFFNSPGGQATVQTAGDLMTGSQTPGLILTPGRVLTADEFRTGTLLAEKEGLQLASSLHVGEEFVDSAGKTYDALGTPKAFEFFDFKSFTRSIQKHLNKSNDFTVIDFTGANSSQIDAVRGYVNGLAKEAQEKIKFVRQ